MAFSITAELPLGSYRGASADGRVERFPSVSRLYSALLCAAGFGPRAEERDGRTDPCEADVAALRWLEDHPPDSVSIPALQVNHGTTTAYRNDGTLKKSKTTWTVKKLPKNPDMSVAVNGRFVWTWSSPPPPEVIEALQALCPDVPYLGTAESPVRLSTTFSDVEPTHTLDEGAGLFTPGGEDIDLPTTGRLDELVAEHRAATEALPTVKQDSHGTDERSASPVPQRTAVAVARYAPTTTVSRDVPWPEVLLVPLDRSVPERYRVRWAVAAHRALIAAIGDGAPPLVTGVYPPGMARPANRAALHLLDSSQPVDLPGGAPAALALLLPQGAEPADVQTLLEAVGNLASIRGPGGAFRRVVGPTRSLPGDQFWREPQDGAVRLWRTSPPAIPDTRGAGGHWTFAHAALLSLGFVWQGMTVLPRPAGRGDEYYRGVVAAVGGAAASVIAAQPLRTSAVQDYVHRVNPHAVVRPYRATLSVGRLGGDRVLQAVGQSRHLGGGLLVPLDLPTAQGRDRTVEPGDVAP